MHFILADDHALVREGLTSTLRDNITDLTTTQVADGNSLLSALENSADVDLILFDLFMPGTNAFETIARIVSHWPDIPIIIVSAADNPTIINKAIDMGANGYITKSISSGEMLDAINHVLKGGTYIQDVSNNVEQSFFQSPPDDYNVYALRGFTRRQKDVVWLLAQGKGNQEIADLLGVSIHTVKVHVKKIFELLGVSNRTEVLVKLKQLNQNSQVSEV